MGRQVSALRQTIGYEAGSAGVRQDMDAAALRCRPGHSGRSPGPANGRDGP